MAKLVSVKELIENAQTGTIALFPYDDRSSMLLERLFDGEWIPVFHKSQIENKTALERMGWNDKQLLNHCSADWIFDLGAFVTNRTGSLEKRDENIN